MMRILIDADGCPVVDIAVRLSRLSGTECILLCDTAHDIKRDGATTLIFDKGADSRRASPVSATPAALTKKRHFLNTFLSSDMFLAP